MPQVKWFGSALVIGQRADVIYDMGGYGEFIKLNPQAEWPNPLSVMELQKVLLEIEYKQEEWLYLYAPKNLEFAPKILDAGKWHPIAFLIDENRVVRQIVIFSQGTLKTPAHVSGYPDRVVLMLPSTVEFSWETLWSAIYFEEGKYYIVRFFGEPEETEDEYFLIDPNGS